LRNRRITAKTLTVPINDYFEYLFGFNETELLKECNILSNNDNVEILKKFNITMETKENDVTLCTSKDKKYRVGLFETRSIEVCLRKFNNNWMFKDALLCFVSSSMLESGITRIRVLLYSIII
jgi:hypothetical protein